MYQGAFLRLLLLFSLSALPALAFAYPRIEVIPNSGARISSEAVIQEVTTHVPNLEQYDSVRAQVVSNHIGVVDSILVYLTASNGSVRWQRIPVDQIAPLRNWISETLPASDSQRTTLAKATTAFCPDPSIQFISFSPRYLPWDQASAKEVAQAAEQAGLKTVLLLGSDATRQNYLNYLSCPALVGNFYDGDANPGEIDTYDAPLSAQDFSIVLKGAFRHHVINVWVACKAFNDPMLSAVVDDAEAQQFIAGQVDLVSVFSDHTGVCTMKEILQGRAVSDAFNECKAQYDLKFHDRWGIAGSGSDYLGE